MPIYNAYTKTDDFPILPDAWTIVLGTLRMPSTTKRILNSSSPYFLLTEQEATGKEYSKMFNLWATKYNIPLEIIEEWNRKAYANASTEEQKNWWQKLANKVTTTVNTFISNAGQVLTNAGESAALAPLLPFKLAMVNALKRQGENVSMSSKLFDVASLFKQKIIDRSSTTNYLEHADIDVEQIIQLVTTILPFFTLILEKVKSGKATNEEKLINGDAETEAEKTTSGGAPTTTGVNAPTDDNWFSKYKWVIIGAVAVVLFLAFRKKK